jgi:ribosomal protein S18 acetylase RimI-like enzyme
MEHVLDNPAWNALQSGNAHLAKGSGDVKFFDKEVSPFVGFETTTDENFLKLYDTLPDDRAVVFVSPVEIEIPKQWKVIHPAKGLQMVYTAKDDAILTLQPKLLSIEHVPQMLALTKLTKPGPFEARTIEFGHYYGIFDGDKLVAMAGQRLHIANYAEISAVCTHPDYLGRGYAKQLLAFHINRIRAAENIPILHVRYNNERAISVYQQMGFTVSRDMYFIYCEKNK